MLSAHKAAQLSNDSDARRRARLPAAFKKIETALMQAIEETAAVGARSLAWLPREAYYGPTLCGRTFGNSTWEDYENPSTLGARSAEMDRHYSDLLSRLRGLGFRVTKRWYSSCVTIAWDHQVVPRTPEV